MAEERFEEKTEPASPRRRQEARERGHVAKSQDLSSAVILLAALLALNLLGTNLLSDMMKGTKIVLGSMGEIDLDREGISGHAFAAGLFTAQILLPFLVLLAASALAIHLAQVGFLFAPDPLAPDPSRLDPAAGLQRIFSWRSLARLLFGLGKLAVICIVLVATLRGQTTNVLLLSEMQVGEIVRYLIDTGYLVSMRVALALLILGLLEYGYQRWQYEEDLRMSRQEVKEELKRMEGDPRIRERRRAVQRQLAQQRMMAAVPKAAVVITNPTELAIALQYDDGMAAPKVVAKGAELIAERIRSVALEHGIPIVERKPLAQALYHTVEVGKDIPSKFYEAVAEVLAYVYSLKPAVSLN